MLLYASAISTRMAQLMFQHLTLCMLGNFSCFCCCLLTFQNQLFKKNLQEHYESVNGLGPDQDQPSVGPDLDQRVGPDLGPNCLQRLSVDEESPLVRKELLLTFLEYNFDLFLRKSVCSQCNPKLNAYSCILA